MINRFFSKKNLSSCLLAGASISSLAIAADNFSFTKIADGNTPRPDGGTFFIKNDVSIPALDGSRLVFIAGNTLDTYSAWSANINGTDFVKLADLNTPVPGGVGHFTTLNHVGTPLIKDGSVVISGRDANNALHFTVHNGLYRVSAQGGSLTKIVDYHDTIPNRGTENFQGWGGDSAGGPRSFSVNGGRVAFFGVNYNSSGGTYLINLNGSGLKPIAVDFDNFRCPNDVDTMIFPLGGFSFPSLNGKRMSFWGNGVFDPVHGSNKIFVGADDGSFVGALSDPTTCKYVASGNHLIFPLPDVPYGPTHTNYTPSTQMDGNIIVFRAMDSRPPENTLSHLGLFAVCADGSSSANNIDGTPSDPTCGLPKRENSSDSPFTPIVTTETSLVGLSGTINRNSFSYAADHGQVLFRALDSNVPTTNEGLYLAKLSDGSINRIIGTGDTLDGKQVEKLGNPQAGSLSGGNFVFTVEFSDFSQGLYASTQGCAANVSSSVSVKRSAYRLNRATGRYVQSVTIKNTGAIPINSPISLVLSNLSSSTPLINKTGNTSCLAPLNASYKSVTVPGNALAPGSSVTEMFEFTNSGTKPILYTLRVSANSGP